VVASWYVLIELQTGQSTADGTGELGHRASD
jgi:hypothetical protein